MMRWLAVAFVVSVVWLFPIGTVRADAPATRAARPARPQPTTRHWTIDGVDREARIYLPAPAVDDADLKPAPLIFGFHGHGGTIASYEAHARLERHWPEAMVVYPQGLKTPGRLTDPQGKAAGWQSAPGEQGDRDLKFVDAMLASLEKDYPVDRDRIYVTGHSNGGTFTYVLWRARREEFAAFAPVASALTMITRNYDAAPAELPDVESSLRPVLHIAGQNDPLVKFAWQERTIQALRRINHCAAEGKPWDPPHEGCTIYPSDAGAPVATYIHPGGHAAPADSGAVIDEFFKHCVRPSAKPTTHPAGS